MDFDRRNLGTMLLGLVGGGVGISILTGCSGEASAASEPGTAGPEETVGVVHAAMTGSATLNYADTISELRSLSGTTSTFAVLKGVSTIFDGGGGLFIWSATAVADDGWNVLNASSGNSAGWRRVAVNVVYAASVTALRSVPGTGPQAAILQGYSTSGDGGGGLFVWSIAAAPDDGGTILNAGSGNSAGWRRVFTGHYDIRWFGASSAVPNNYSNITAALTAASNAGGGVVFIPAGTFNCGSPVDLPVNVSIRGAGMAVSVLHFNGGGNGIQCTHPLNSGGTSRSFIEDLEIVGTSSTAGYGVWLQASGRLWITRCAIATFQVGTYFNEPVECSIRHCTFVTQIGVWLTGGSNYQAIVEVSYNDFDGGVIGVVDEGGYQVRIEQNNFTGLAPTVGNPASYGIYLCGSYTVRVASNYFELGVPCVALGYLSYQYLSTGSGSSSGSNVQVIIDDNFMSTTAEADITAMPGAGVMSLVVTNNEFNRSATCCVSGIANVYELVSTGNKVDSGKPMYDHPTSASFSTISKTKTGVGIGSLLPNCALDVMFHVAIRAGSASINGGSTYNDFILNGRSVLELVHGTGTGGSTITGFSGGNDGQLLDIYNFTGEPITFSHLDDLSVSTNQIMCQAGAPGVTISGGQFSIARFRYSLWQTKWLLIDHT